MGGNAPHEAKRDRFAIMPSIKISGDSMLIGYARVSTFDQSTELQVNAFKKSGITCIHQEKQSSVKHRPVLERLIEHELKPGDILCVYKLDRLARSMSHFVRIFERLKAKKVGFKSLTESIETETPQGRMFVQLLGVFAEFERELIRERCLAGQVAARARGQTWGKKPIFTMEESKKLAGMWRDGWVDQHTLAMMFECHVSTIRDAIHKAESRGRWRPLVRDK
jgi:DNA invertase Pin-like site-specific DNA recombinase